MPERRRMFYNDDGDTCLAQYRGGVREEMATDAVDTLLGTPVTTLVYCVSYSDTGNYPSQVISRLGWRELGGEEVAGRNDGPPLATVRYWAEHGWDVPAMIMARAAEKGLEFIPSMRMNDAHFCQTAHPRVNRLTGRFWLENQDLIITPNLEWRPERWPTFVLDFRHEKVRAFRLANADEIIARYGAQGFEMDWTRHYRFFADGRAQPDLITDMVRRVRRRLDARGGGRRLPLIVRVAGSVGGSLAIGLDVGAWVREGLVDYIVPSDPTRQISPEMPVAEWIDLVRGSGVEVHPSPESCSWRGGGEATLEMYRAAASNYYAQGAHGVYLYNVFTEGLPLQGWQYVMMRDVSCPEALARTDKTFFAIAARGDAVRALYPWRRPAALLPIRLAPGGEPAVTGLWVGDDLAAAARASTLGRAALRVRLSDLGPGDRLEVLLNGRPLDLAAARLGTADYRARRRFGRRGATAAPHYRAWWGLSATLRWNLADPEGAGLRRGDNAISVRWCLAEGADPGERARAGEREMWLLDVDLAVCYDPLGKDPPPWG